MIYCDLLSFVFVLELKSHISRPYGPTKQPTVYTTPLSRSVVGLVKGGLVKKMKNRRTCGRKNTHKTSSPAAGEASPPAQVKLTSAAPVASPGGVVKRRPIRPIDRQKMRDWLLDKLERAEMSEQLSWLDKEKGTFCVTWCHAARHGYEVSQHAPLFKAWATHTEKFKDGDEENHKTWKANFRCALHSVPDIQEVTKDGERKGRLAKRVYQFLDTPAIAKKPRKVRKGRKSSDLTKAVEMDPAEDSDSGMSMGNNLSCPATPPLSDNVPDFRQLGISTVAGVTTTTITSSRHASGGCVMVSREVADCGVLSPLPAVTLHGESIISLSGMDVEMDGDEQQTAGALRTRCLSGDSGNASSGTEEDIPVEEFLLMFKDFPGDVNEPWSDMIFVEGTSIDIVKEESVITENVDTCTDESYTSLANVLLKEELSLPDGDMTSYPQ